MDESKSLNKSEINNKFPEIQVQRAISGGGYINVAPIKKAIYGEGNGIPGEDGVAPELHKTEDKIVADVSNGDLLITQESMNTRREEQFPIIAPNKDVVSKELGIEQTEKHVSFLFSLTPHNTTQEGITKIHSELSKAKPTEIQIPVSSAQPLLQDIDTCSRIYLGMAEVATQQTADVKSSNGKQRRAISLGRAHANIAIVNKFAAEAIQKPEEVTVVPQQVVDALVQVQEHSRKNRQDAKNISDALFSQNSSVINALVENRDPELDRLEVFTKAKENALNKRKELLQKDNEELLDRMHTVWGADLKIQGQANSNTPEAAKHEYFSRSRTTRIMELILNGENGIDKQRDVLESVQQAASAFRYDTNGKVIANLAIFPETGQITEASTPGATKMLEHLKQSDPLAYGLALLKQLESINPYDMRNMYGDGIFAKTVQELSSIDQIKPILPDLIKIIDETNPEVKQKSPSSVNRLEGINCLADAVNASSRAENAPREVIELQRELERTREYTFEQIDFSALVNPPKIEERPAVKTTQELDPTQVLINDLRQKLNESAGQIKGAYEKIASMKTEKRGGAFGIGGTVEITGLNTVLPVLAAITKDTQREDLSTALKIFGDASKDDKPTEGLLVQNTAFKTLLKPLTETQDRWDINNIGDVAQTWREMKASFGIPDKLDDDSYGKQIIDEIEMKIAQINQQALERTQAQANELEQQTKTAETAKKSLSQLAPKTFKLISSGV